MSTRDLTDLVYDEMHATRWDLADWELRELAQTAAGVFRSHPCDHEAQIRDLLEEREELLTEIVRLRMGNHPAGRAIPDAIRACWENDGVMHICGEEERCEELDTRPPVDAMGRPRHLALAEALTERDAEHEGGGVS